MLCQLLSQAGVYSPQLGIYFASAVVVMEIQVGYAQVEKAHRRG